MNTVTQSVWWEWEKATVGQTPINKMKRKAKKMMSQGGEFLLEEAEPLFRGSNLNKAKEEDEEEPLFVLELAAEPRAAANRFHLSFPNHSLILCLRYCIFISILF
jgi:hypothetical protein